MDRGLDLLKTTLQEVGLETACVTLTLTFAAAGPVDLGLAAICAAAIYFTGKDLVDNLQLVADGAELAECLRPILQKNIEDTAMFRFTYRDGQGNTVEDYQTITPIHPGIFFTKQAELLPKCAPSAASALQCTHGQLATDSVSITCLHDGWNHRCMATAADDSVSIT